MAPVLLDANYVIALEAADDQNHTAATRHWRELVKSMPTLVTTSFIFGEVVTFFNNRHRHDKAVEVGNKLMSSGSVELVHVDEELFFLAWSYFAKHGDKSYSLADCVSFVLMHRSGIEAALTFDRHFAQAGFTMLP